MNAHRMSVGIHMPIFAPETSVTTRMDLVYHLMMWLLSVRPDMASYSNRQLHIWLVLHALIGTWMVLSIMTAQTATSYYIVSATISILVWLHGIAPRKYLYLQERLPSIVEGFVQCVGWLLQTTQGHIRTSLSAHGVLNMCTIFLVKLNTSSRFEYKDLQMNHQGGPDKSLLLDPASGVAPSTAMRWRSRMLQHTINTFFIGPC